MLTERIAEGVCGSGVSVPETCCARRISLKPRVQRVEYRTDFAGRASEGVYFAPRLGRMRLSPHVYNDEVDADRFVEVLGRRMRG